MFPPLPADAAARGNGQNFARSRLQGNPICENTIYKRRLTGGDVVLSGALMRVPTVAGNLLLAVQASHE
jgi:hypothetical protein